MDSSLFLSKDDVNILLNKLIKKYKIEWEIKFTGDNFILKRMMINTTIEYNGYNKGIIKFNCENNIIVRQLVKTFQEIISRKLPDFVNLSYPNGTIDIKKLDYKGKKIFDNNIAIEGIEINNGFMIKFNLTNLDLL